MQSYYDSLMTTSTASGQKVYAGDTETVRMPEVIAEAQELSTDIEHIGKLVSEIEQRFQGVLQVVPPQQAAEGDSTQPDRPRDPSALHALELRRMRLRTEYIRQYLQSILSRCECG